MRKISLFLLIFQVAVEAFVLSVGGFDIDKYPSLYSFHDEKPIKVKVPITELLREQSKNVNGVTMWITRDWREDWYDANTVQKEIVNRGYTPVYIFYYFADDISVAFIKEKKADYFKQLEKFLTYVKKIDGRKIVILNPEYNMKDVAKWKGMNKIFLKSFALLRKDPQIIVGPCVGDFGNYDKVNALDEWILFDPSIAKAAKSADFIAFQEMRAVTRNTKKQILKTPLRSYYFSKYLHTKYKKPVMLAYVAVSSYGKDAEEIQKDVYKGFVSYLPKMKRDSELELFGIFHYFDYPKHQGYFKKAEEFFGVLRKDGVKKPSFQYFHMLD